MTETIRVEPALASAPARLGQTRKDYSEASRRLMLVRAFRAMLATGLSPRAAARQVGAGRASIWRWERVVNGHDLDNPLELQSVLEKLVAPLADPLKAGARGQRSKWEPLLLIEAVQQELRSLHAATLRASSDGATRDRRTGNYTATMRLFTTSVHCPEGLKPLLLEGKFPDCFKRFLAQVTPEIEALIRGPKHSQLNGFAGSRDKTIGLPDGRRAYMPSGWEIQLDDMSVNQPFWVEGSDGKPILSRQGLYARCKKGRWLGVELIARPRESYRAADILRFVRRLCQLYGKPSVLRIEQSVWAARSIAGFSFEPTHGPSGEGNWKEDITQRPAMVAEEKQNLADGLEAIGIRVEYCHSARGKADLEGAFDPLQTYLAGFTRDFPNIGRHAGEFEHAAKQLRRVRAESHHPRDLGFPHQNELLVRIQQTFDFINSLPRARAIGDPEGPGKTTADEIWQRDTARWPLTPLAGSDLATFLPTLRQCRIVGGAVYPKCDGVRFPFRALEFADLGDSFKTFVRFDETEPSLGAAIYSRELRSGANHQQHAHGDFICYARFDVPAPGDYAGSVPAGVPTFTTEQLYGAGAEADGGALLKQQQKSARMFVRSAFSGRLPGQGAARAVEVRDGRSVGKVQIGGSPAADRMESASVALPEPKLPARPLPLRNVGVTEEDFDRQSERLARDEVRAARASCRRQQQTVLAED